MKLFSVAIGKKYEREAERLSKCVPVEVFTKDNSNYKRVNDDPLIDGLWHKTNFANYIDDDVKGPVIFMDADMFTLKDNPFKTFKVKKSTDFAYVPYVGKWYLPDNKRQEAFNFHGHKINSGFMYFKNLQVAQKVCSQWQYEYLERAKLYDVEKSISKNEYDEWALMIALQKLNNIKVELLDSKWNNWELKDKDSILNSESVFIQSHNYLDILDAKNK